MPNLKAFVRIDGTGRVVPGTLLLRYKKPGVGKWLEIDATECCNPSGDTRVAYNTCSNGCSGRCIPEIIYLFQSCIDNPQAGCQVWSDEAGTIPAPNDDYSISLPGGIPGYITVVGGVVTVAAPCP